MKSLIKAIATTAILSTAVLAPAVAFAGETVATGSFTGANDHITTGGVSVVTTANGGAVVILDTDFSLDGAPAPSVGFGKDGEYVAASDLGTLEENTGLQVFVVPEGVDVSDFNEVYIWCDEFTVSLGVASLS